MHDRVFVRDPTGGSIVVVTDHAGAVVQQITAEEGAAGLVLPADSTKLYVALSTAGGKLWFGYAVDSSGGGIGSLDVASPAQAATLESGTTFSFRTTVGALRSVGLVGW
ncbi:hypothetical protein [Streptomyces sp. NPDC050121]|uniref:hypothetical protein n=1 Tax=Streptomyces sp. NPDC050121 TaxID=3365601 RepID=UPI00379CDA2B